VAQQAPVATGLRERSLTGEFSPTERLVIRIIIYGAAALSLIRVAWLVVISLMFPSMELP
jgi:hypothetical protein